jgi:hypothetical protein
MPFPPLLPANDDDDDDDAEVALLLLMPSRLSNSDPSASCTYEQGPSLPFLEPCNRFLKPK